MTGVRTPLDDAAAMYLTATRIPHHRPCIGLLWRFDEEVGAEALLRWANERASDPRGLGRRVVAPRVPGARRRWVPTTALPRLRFEPGPLDGADLAALVEEELSGRPDPAESAGWQLLAARTRDGGTVVALWLNHAYGDARGILSTAAPATGTPPETHGTPRWRTRTVEELTDVVQRLGSGVGGSVRLGRDAVRALGSLSPGGSAGELTRLRPALTALLDRDPGIGARSGRRTVALARVPAARWAAAARARDGSSNTLLMALTANLLRHARLARGEDGDRPVRVLMPVDLRSRSAGEAPDPTRNTVAGATVVLPGGPPGHGSLAGVRTAVTSALTTLTTGPGRGRPDPRPAGVVDAMRLLPDALAHRIAVLAQGADGVASHVGRLAPEVCRLGPHQAAATYLLGGPMLSDVTVCLGRSGTDVTLGVMADAGRLGPGGHLPAVLTGELAAWGLPARVE